MVEGEVRDEFRRVAGVFERQIAKTPGGASVAVFHRGQLVVDLWGGRRDTQGTPWTRDTLAMCYSTTKGVVATAAHVLADRGLLDYDAPVAAYWPEFAQNGKDTITVRHVLSHSAGLHRFGTIVDHTNRMLDWDHMTDALARAEPAYPPGTTVGYHALTFGWLVGEIVRRISGLPINQFVQANIAQPLGLHGLYIGCPPEERHRVAPLRPLHIPLALRGVGRLALRPGVTRALKAVRGGTINPARIQTTLIPRGIEAVLVNPAVLDAEIPSMNGHFDAISLATMYAMLANRGEFGGVRILTPETVARLSEVQNDQPDGVVMMNMQWRLGYHRVPRVKALPFAYGHLGFGGSGAWADPQNDVALAFVCNGGATTLADRRIMDLTNAVAKSVLRPPAFSPQRSG